MIVSTYDKLHRFAEAFGAGHLNLLIVVSAPGLGKSSIIKRAVGKDCTWIDGTASALGIYIAAYQNRGKPIVLDDVDGLYRSQSGVRLLKSLCQTEEVKSVSWQTSAGALDKHDVPRAYDTTSPVAILANRWETANDDVAALEDRGHFIRFEPRRLEVHLQAAKWYWDQDVYDAVGDHLHLLQRHSLRLYPLLAELRAAGLDWRGALARRCVTGTALEVLLLSRDERYSSAAARAREFISRGLGSRATYYNHVKQLAPHEDVPRVQLTAAAPGADDECEIDEAAACA